MRDASWIVNARLGRSVPDDAETAAYRRGSERDMAGHSPQGSDDEVIREIITSPSFIGLTWLCMRYSCDRVDAAFDVLAVEMNEDVINGVARMLRSIRLGFARSDNRHRDPE